MVTILKNGYTDDLRCAVAEEGFLATVTEADEALAVLYKRLEVTIFLNGPVQETVTVFICYAMWKIGNVFVSSGILMCFCDTLHIVVFFHAFSQICW